MRLVAGLLRHGRCCSNTHPRMRNARLCSAAPAVVGGFLLLASAAPSARGANRCAAPCCRRSRALRLGDFVKIGEVEGSVVHLGTLATKIKTAHNEDITIPNAVVVSTATTNYSRHAAEDGVFIPTSLTVGYDVPWRQVRGLLLAAAEKTPGIRVKPPPAVRQSTLLESAVEYTLLVCLEQPPTRGHVLAASHANILDAFNEYGVQIMSPRDETDPTSRKTVPKSDWFAAPARTD